MGYPGLYVHFYTFTSSQQLPKQVVVIAALPSPIFQTHFSYSVHLKCAGSRSPHFHCSSVPITLSILGLLSPRGLCRCDVPIPVCFILTFDAVRSSNPMSWQLQQQQG